MKAEILTVGDEVLSGIVVNTDASFLAAELEKLGFKVARIVTVGDDAEALIAETKSFLASDYDYLITTGGLGPTHDDFTKEILFRTLGMKAKVYPEAVNRLEEYFSHDYAECNRKQALYPEGAVLLPNDFGTALGAYAEKDGKMYTILPGPPGELQPMVLRYLLPLLKKKIKPEKIVREYIVMGIGESKAEDLLRDFYRRYQNETLGICLASYVSIGKIRYVMTGSVHHPEFIEAADAFFRKIMGNHLISDCGETIEQKVVSELKRLGYKISFSESCTGGLLAAQLINVASASAVTEESFITYSEEAKIKRLGVKPEIIEKYGMVSEETAEAMAIGTCSVTGAEVGVAVTGYAGPEGGTEKAPVGTVCYAIDIKGDVCSFRERYKLPRNALRKKVMMNIYWHLYLLLRL